MKYEFLEHTADIKFRAYGKSLGECFGNAALAMFNAMYKGKVKSALSKKVKVKGDDLEGLLYNFLEELIVLVDAKNFFVSRVDVKVDIGKMEVFGEIFGDDAKNYAIGLDVKAITYNDMFVREENGKWVCQVVVDV